MYMLKKYVVIPLLTIFVFGSMAATAFAYCGSGHDASSMINGLHASDSVTHHQAVMMDHGNDGAGDVAKHHSSTDENSSSPDCLDCYGSLCHNQSFVAFQLALGLYSPTAALHIEQEINLKLIILTSIPQPPKQLS